MLASCPASMVNQTRVVSGKNFRVGSVRSRSRGSGSNGAENAFQLSQVAASDPKPTLAALSTAPQVSRKGWCFGKRRVQYLQSRR